MANQPTHPAFTDLAYGQTGDPMCILAYRLRECKDAYTVLRHAEDRVREMDKRLQEVVLALPATRAESFIADVFRNIEEGVVNRHRLEVTEWAVEGVLRQVDAEAAAERSARQ